MTASDLPPDLTMLARIVDRQSPAARELFHYALVLLLVEVYWLKTSSAPV